MILSPDIGRFLVRVAKAKNVKKLLRRVLLLGCLSLLLLIVFSWILVYTKSRGQITYSAEELELSAVAIVPGARVWSDGTPSVPLRQRLDAAKELYELGTVKHILVSGDNRRSHYDETSVMGRYLINAGIDASDVTLDYAGFDTWDTCLRAAEQFGVTKAVFVTQGRYASRSASLCEAAEIDVQVYALDSVAESSQIRLKATLRERLAVVKAASDIVRKPRAHHGGPFIGLIGSQTEAETDFANTTL